MESIPHTGKTWRVASHTGFEGLQLDEKVPIQPIGSYECLVKIEAVSLNFRDLMVAEVRHEFAMKLMTF